MALIHCPECNTEFRGPDYLYGTTTQCPRCRSSFVATKPLTAIERGELLLEVTGRSSLVATEPSVGQTDKRVTMGVNAPTQSRVDATPTEAGSRNVNVGDPFPFCRVLRQVLMISGWVSFLLAAIVIVAAISRAPELKEGSELVLAMILSCAIVLSGFTQLASAELLGGIVAWLRKNKHFPEPM